MRAGLAALAALLIGAGPVGVPSPPVSASAHRAFVTASPAAQAAFDRGLVMLYAFNVGEARVAFRAAEGADPHALLPYVGEAVSDTIDINLPSTPEGERRGADAVARAAKSSAPDAPADERALLAATAQRFDQRKSQAQRFSAYFNALQAYADANPADGFGRTLAAYAGWNATGLLTGGPHDDLTADAVRIAGDLEAALKIDPSDVGAHHLRIHFWEQAHRPERALADADYLAGLTYEPGESHLEHMAGHIYDRVGQYADMVRVNEGACHNDVAYFRLGDGPGQQYMRTYHEHDVNFVLYGLTTMGRAAQARGFAARESAYSSSLTALRLHDNREVLALLGDAITPVRVIAEARAGDLDQARKDYARLPRASGDDASVETHIAAAVLARAAHDETAAIGAYRAAQAAAGTDDLGDPKLHWTTPIGEGLGATLLEAQRPAEAEVTFSAELLRYPHDPHLEFGLAEALAAQGKDDRAARAAYSADWFGPAPLHLGDLG